MGSKAGRAAATRRDELSQAEGIEWPTVGLAVGIYVLFALLTWNHAALPWWVLLPLGTAVVVLQGSLQHEVIHGHPTRHRWLNDALGRPTFWLWLPYDIYRQLHLRHHRNDILTDPLDDPESYYVTAGQWRSLARPMRAVLIANQTLTGRLLVGPVLAIAGFWREEYRRFASGDHAHGRIWLEHLGWMALLLAWVLGVCGLAFWQYLACFVLPGTALTMLRSYMEHRPAVEPGARCAVVENAGAFGFLFLHNNLHAVHHRWPGVAWYQLPALYRARRDEILAWNGGYLISGYQEIARHFLLRPKDHPVHPDHA